MNEKHDFGSFRLLGHDFPLGRYPGPVVPIGIKDGFLVAVYRDCDDAQYPEIQFIRIPNDSAFVPYNTTLLASLGTFDPNRDILFAESPEAVRVYKSTSELNKRRLAQDDDPFRGLSIALGGHNMSDIRDQLKKCLVYLSDEPGMIDDWYRTMTFELRRRRVKMSFPAKWQDLLAESDEGPERTEVENRMLYRSLLRLTNKAPLPASYAPKYHVRLYSIAKPLISVLAVLFLAGTGTVWLVVRHSRTVKPQLLATMHNDAQVEQVVFSPDSSKIVTASLDNVARIWSASTGRRLDVLNVPGEQAAFSPDGKWIATVSRDGRSFIWDTTNDHLVPMLKHSDPIEQVAFSPDGKRIATVSRGGVAQLLDTSNGQRLATLAHDDQVVKVAFSRDGKLIETASREFSQIWDGSGLPLAKHRFPFGLKDVTFSTDGKLIAGASREGPVQIWNASSGQLLAIIEFRGQVEQTVFSPDGGRIAIVGYDGTAGIWDTSSGKLLATLGPDALVLKAAFSFDGKRLVTTDWDGTARIWDATHGRKLAILKHDGEVKEAVFSPDGKRLVTASWNGTAEVWDVSH